MFQQLLTPVADSLGLSFVVASLPILTVLVLLGVLRRRPGRPRSPACRRPRHRRRRLATAVGLALDATLNGVVFALWPVMWIVVNAMLLYNIAVTLRPLRRVPALD